MKAVFTSKRGDYLSNATVGKEYEITDIQDGIFAGDYYAIFIGDNGKESSCYYWRFNIPREVAEAYVVEHHLDWRKAAVFPSQTCS